MSELNKLEIQQAVLESRLEETIVINESFQKEVLAQLGELKTKDVQMSQYIDTQMEKDKTAMEKEKASLDLKREVIAKLATTGIVASITGLGAILWYAVKHFFKIGGS